MGSELRATDGGGKSRGVEQPNTLLVPFLFVESVDNNDII